MVREVDVAFKTKVCTECNGDRRTRVRPVIYIDVMGNEYPFPEYTSMGTVRGELSSKKLPTDVTLYEKLEECSRCGGTGRENVVKRSL